MYIQDNATLRVVSGKALNISQGISENIVILDDAQVEVIAGEVEFISKPTTSEKKSIGIGGKVNISGNAKVEAIAT